MDASEGIIALSEASEATAQVAVITLESEMNDAVKKAGEDTKKKDVSTGQFFSEK